MRQEHYSKFPFSVRAKSVKLIKFNLLSILNFRFNRKSEITLFYRLLLEINEKVRSLSERFPWILHLYFGALTLEYVEKLLNSAGDNFSNAQILLSKLSQFWKQMNYNASLQKVGSQKTAAINNRLF